MFFKSGLTDSISNALKSDELGYCSEIYINAVSFPYNRFGIIDLICP
jgi:hypothetical protein